MDTLIAIDTVYVTNTVTNGWDALVYGMILILMGFVVWLVITKELK